MKTIKQIADELGVSKQAVAKRATMLPPTEVTTNERGIKLISPNGELILKNSTTNRQPTKAANLPPTNTAIDTVIDMLKAELDIKNEQIRDLNARLAESSAALTAAQQSAQFAQQLHAGTIHTQLIDGQADPVDAVEPNAPEVKAWESQSSPTAPPAGFGERLKFLLSGKLQP